MKFLRVGSIKLSYCSIVQINYWWDTFCLVYLYDWFCLLDLYRIPRTKHDYFPNWIPVARSSQNESRTGTTWRLENLEKMEGSAGVINNRVRWGHAERWRLQTTPQPPAAGVIISSNSVDSKLADEDESASSIFIRESDLLASSAVCDDRTLLNAATWECAVLYDELWRQVMFHCRLTHNRTHYLEELLRTVHIPNGCWSLFQIDV